METLVTQAVGIMAGVLLNAEQHGNAWVISDKEYWKAADAVIEALRAIQLPVRAGTPAADQPKDQADL